MCVLNVDLSIHTYTINDMIIENFIVGTAIRNFRL